MEKISVVIPSYNSAKTIRNCILSIINTGYPELEIIVVDDASTDESPKIVEVLSREFPHIVRCIYHKINQGPAKARNTGARQASGEYLFFLDADTEMLKDTLDNFVKRIKYADAVTGIYHFQPLNRGIPQEYKALLNYYFFSRKGVTEYEVFDSSRAGIKTEVFRRLGGFNENIIWGMDYENEEFGYRLCKKYKNVLDPGVMVKHMFPGVKKMTQNYFLRVAVWLEIFFHRKQFESGGLTTLETGFSTLALFLALLFSSLIIISKGLAIVSLLFFVADLYGYSGFFIFVFNQRKLFFLLAVILNIYFSIIIGLGALWGLIKVLIGRSSIKLGYNSI